MQTKSNSEALKMTVLWTQTLENFYSRWDKEILGRSFYRVTIENSQYMLGITKATKGLEIRKCLDDKIAGESTGIIQHKDKRTLYYNSTEIIGENGVE